MNRIILFFLFSILLVFPALAGENNKDKKATIEAKPESSATHQSIRIDGQTIKYTATIGWLIMKNDKNGPIARFD